MRCRSSALIALPVSWLLLGGMTNPVPRDEAGRPAAFWRLDNLSELGGHAVTTIGQPRVVETDRGPAVEFNGRTDGLLVGANPLEGLATFTVDVMFQPAPRGPAEQRFLHFEEDHSGNRALIETRMLSPDTWCLDTFLRHGTNSLTLIDRTATHPAGRWHVATLTYDGRTMKHYVDGRLEGSGDVAFRPLGPGRTSIGVRLNRVHWFAGRIHHVRISSQVQPDGSTGRFQVRGPAARERSGQARGAAAAGEADVGAVERQHLGAGGF